MSFELRIGELVVDGLAADRGRLGAAVEGELGLLAAQRGVPAAARRGASVDLLDAGPVAGDSDVLGRDLARAVWEALDR